MGSYPIYESSTFSFLIPKFYKIVFVNSLIIGSIITISSHSWIIIWIGIELNIISFIPLIYNKKSIYSREATIKYFIVQTLASTILIFSIIIIETSLNLTFKIFINSSLILLYSSLLMKIGIAPFHFWFPEVIEGLSWNSRFILLTWQKLAPISVITIILQNNFLIIVSILSSSVLGRIIGLNQIRLRKILAYSSINHIAWILIGLINSIYIWLIYFLVYVVSNFNLIFIFSKFNIFNINQLNTLKLSFLEKGIISLNFLSLAGLPPIIGFLPKWLVISKTVCNNQIIIPTILIISTLIAIYFYLRIIFPLFILKTTKLSFHSINSKTNFFFILFNISFLLSLIITRLFFA